MAQKFNFKRLEEPFEADWPVKVNVPEDGGKTTVEEFMARFRIVRDAQPPAIADPATELTDAEQQASAEPTPTEAAAILERAHRKLREKAVEQWRAWFVGFGKPTSGEEELTDEVLWNLITTPYVRRAVLEAYEAFSLGIAAKN
ncbi:hypothetical protein [Phenylobacterium sp.]|uniref:hypothetical protein n=1 Tax=Phenylobacterium sp. TaxID=1871053 RepID=UPI003918973C